MTEPTAPPRFEATLFVGRADTHATWGLVADLSVTGMRLKTEQVDPIGARVDLVFIWGDEEFTCPVEVVRHCEGGLAVRFLTLDPERDAAIAEITADVPQRRRTDLLPGGGMPG